MEYIKLALLISTMEGDVFLILHVSEGVIFQIITITHHQKYISLPEISRQDCYHKCIGVMWQAFDLAGFVSQNDN